MAAADKAADKSVVVGQRVKLEYLFSCSHVSFTETEIGSDTIIPMNHTECPGFADVTIISVRAVPDHTIREEDLSEEEKENYESSLE